MVCGSTTSSIGPSTTWTAVASSGEGRVLVGVAGGAQIQVSSDYGATWTGRDASRNWIAIAVSEDGNAMLATENGGAIYQSADEGVSWSAVMTARRAIPAAFVFALLALVSAGPISSTSLVAAQ